MKNRILIKGAYGQPNLGDDILMLVLDNVLKTGDFDYKFLLPHNTKGYVEKYTSQYLYDDQTIESDILVYGGGTQFYQFEKTASNARKRLLLNFLSNPISLILYLKSKMRGSNKEVSASRNIAIGIGIGPFVGKYGIKKKKSVTKLLSMFDLLIVRDSISYEFVKKIPVKTYLGNDLCFIEENFLPFKLIVRKSQNLKKITIIIRDWPHSEDVVYIKSIVEFIKQNSEFNIIVVLFSNERYCERLLVKNGINYIKWDPFQYSMQQFIDIVYDTDLIISSRYHGCVLSSLFSIPFISISVDPKLAIFADDIYGADRNWNYPYNVENLNELINDFKINKDNYVLYIRDKVSQYKNQMIYANNIFKSFLSL